MRLGGYIKFLNLLQIYHWQTESYSRHKASGELYEKMQGHIDKFIESFQSDGETVKFDSTIKLTNMSDQDGKILLKDFLKFLEEDESEKFNDREDILNIIYEMMSDINQTLYLFNKK